MLKAVKSTAQFKRSIEHPHFPSNNNNNNKNNKNNSNNNSSYNSKPLSLLPLPLLLPSLEIFS